MASSKKFWKPCASSINLKKDRAKTFIPKSLKIDSEIIEDTYEIVNEFYKHFSSFSAGNEAISKTIDLVSFLSISNVITRVLVTAITVLVLTSNLPQLQ